MIKCDIISLGVLNCVAEIYRSRLPLHCVAVLENCFEKQVNIINIKKLISIYKRSVCSTDSIMESEEYSLSLSLSLAFSKCNAYDYFVAMHLNTSNAMADDNNNNNNNNNN